MDTLSIRERELVALGAALGSNCVPCIEYHVPEARKAGLTDQQIGEAIRLADTVRKVPARKVLNAAVGMLANNDAEAEAERCGDDSARSASGTETSQRCCG